jgi:hypothetical protein
MSLAARAAATAFGVPLSAARYSTDRDRFEFSTVSRSTTSTFPTPSRARFLRISLPERPGPDHQHLAPASFCWSHHRMSRNRLNRSSASSDGDTSTRSGAGEGGADGSPSTAPFPLMGGAVGVTVGSRS